MWDSKYKDSYPCRTNTDPVEVAFTGLLLSRGLQYNGFQNMHEHVLTCWWQSHYPNWLSSLDMYSWCQSSAVDANHHIDKILYSFNEISNELHHYHQIHSSSPGQTPFIKVFRTDTLHLPYKYDIISEPMWQCMPSNWRHLARSFLYAILMYRLGQKFLDIFLRRLFYHLMLYRNLS